MAGASLTTKYNVIDVDTHIIETPDLWTSRVSKKWGDLVPHVKPWGKENRDRWFIGDIRLSWVSALAHAGWHEYPPSHPPSLAQADPAGYDAQARVRHMDKNGIHSQVLYPNLIGFQSEAFMQLADRELGFECVRAYNDYLADFCAVAPDRLVAVMWLPFWDVEASVAEIERSVKRGHRGIIFGGDFEAVGLPEMTSTHWDPVYNAAQDLGLSINMHIGFSDRTAEQNREIQAKVINDKAGFVRESALIQMGNARHVADIILSGLCHRFPRLNFVSVESGASWLPYLMEVLDWQWANSGAYKEYSDRLWPSEYFRRQVYGSFWFEKNMLKQTIELFPDNLMFETDFPHPTSLSPGPGSLSKSPKEVIDQHLAGVQEEVISKVLHGNAARIYNLKVPALRE